MCEGPDSKQKIYTARQDEQYTRHANTGLTGVSDKDGNEPSAITLLCTAALPSPCQTLPHSASQQPQETTSGATIS